MNRRRGIVLWLIFFCLVAVLPGLGRRDRSDTVQVTGVVRLVGTGPLPELVISGSEREWYVVREEEHKLRDLQHRTVTVEGAENIIILRFANGLPAGERHTLDRIRIITIH
jgi:hypothetical protein